MEIQPLLPYQLLYVKHWLKEKSPGWKKILTLEGRQVFKVIRLEEGKASFLFVCATSRQEIMEKLTGNFNKIFEEEIYITNNIHQSKLDKANALLEANKAR